jgi:hypothetical protein
MLTSIVPSSVDGLPIWFWIALALVGVGGIVKNTLALRRSGDTSSRSRLRYKGRIAAGVAWVLIILARIFITKG